MLKKIAPESTNLEDVSLRTLQPSDWEFSYSVYASTRMEEMALVDWQAEQKSAFLSMQFDAQRAHYEKYYPHAEYFILQYESQPIGRMIVDRSIDPILLIDIALLPEYRNRGIGTGLVKNLMDEAERSHQSLSLHVETFNPALRLYQRLGFVITDEQGFYYEMTWPSKPEAQ